MDDDDLYLRVDTGAISASMQARSDGNSYRLSPPVAWGTPRYLNTRAGSFTDTSMEDNETLPDPGISIDTHL